jgi:hypothetical protein
VKREVEKSRLTNWGHGVTRHHCGLQLGMIKRGSSDLMMNNWSDDLRRGAPIQLKRWKNMLKINVKNFNMYTIISILFILAGLLLWISWGIRYGIWYDIGIYSLTIVLVLPGTIGTIISLMEKEEEV